MFFSVMNSCTATIFCKSIVLSNYHKWQKRWKPGQKCFFIEVGLLYLKSKIYRELCLPVFLRFQMFHLNDYECCFYSLKTRPIPYTVLTWIQMEYQSWLPAGVMARSVSQSHIVMKRHQRTQNVRFYQLLKPSFFFLLYRSMPEVTELEKWFSRIISLVQLLALFR